MPKYKSLKGVAHDVAHHALSGLSFLHPHLAQVCRKNRLANITLDLLHESPLPLSVPDYEPLTMAAKTLQAKFTAILANAGFKAGDITAARLTFSVTPDAADDYSGVSCTSEITSLSGHVYRHDMPAFLLTISPFPR